MQKRSAEDFEADTFEGVERRFEAYCLRIDTKEQEFGKEGVYVKVRAWCRETHPGLKAFQPENFDDHINIDKFPQYRALTDATPAPNPGEKIWVKYLNVKNLEGARYIEPVKAKEHLVNLIRSVTPAGAFAAHPCGALSSNAMPAGNTSGATTTFPGGNVKLNKVVVIGTSLIGGDDNGAGGLGKALNNVLKDMGAGTIVIRGVAGSRIKQWLGLSEFKKPKAKSSGLSAAQVSAEKPNVFFVAIGGNDGGYGKSDAKIQEFLGYARQIMNTLSPDKSIPIVWYGHVYDHEKAESVQNLYRALDQTLRQEYPNLLVQWPKNDQLREIYLSASRKESKLGRKQHPGSSVHERFVRAGLQSVTTFLGIGQTEQKPEQTDPIAPKSPAQTPTEAPASPPAVPTGCSTVSTIGAMSPGSAAAGPATDLGPAATSLNAVNNPETHWNFPVASAPPADWDIKHFTPRDLQSKGNGMVVMNKKTLRALDKAAGRAAAFGHPPIRLTNQVSPARNGAYRDPELNRKEGGAKGSRHQYGDGFDIWTKGHTKEQRIALLKNLYNVGFRGFGHGVNNIHADTSNRRKWSYNKYPMPAWSEIETSQGTA
jgi:lysophospholipase L1-like esterase